MITGMNWKEFTKHCLFPQCPGSRHKRLLFYFFTAHKVPAHTSTAPSHNSQIQGFTLTLAVIG